MLRKIFFGLSLLCSLTATQKAQAQDIYYSCDFAAGLPSDMTFYDVDGNTPIASMVQAGFSVGKPWIYAYMSSTDKNYFAASMSLYTPSGTSDDWMVLPAVKIYQAGSKLTWRAITCDGSTALESYKVLVSTRSNAVADFNETPLFKTDGENSDGWNDHEVSLDEYVGKEIYIAFVDNSCNKYVLGIDDISIVGPTPLAEFSNLTGSFTTEVQTSVTLRVTAALPAGVNNITAYYKCGDATFSKTVTDLQLKQSESYDVTFDEPLPLTIGEETYFSAWVDVDGMVLQAKTFKTARLTFKPTRRVLIEEGTGTWCPNCVRGNVAVDFLKEKYPDNFIAVAAHGASTMQDPMTCTDYISKLGISSYPLGVVDRKFVAPPLAVLNDTTYTTLMGRNGEFGFEYALLDELAEGTFAEMQTTAAFQDAACKSLTISASARFASNITDKEMKFAFLVVEDSIFNGSYGQSNGYRNYKGYWQNSDTTQAGMGGFESKSNYISGAVMRYNDVVRLMIGDISGIANSLSKTDYALNEVATKSYSVDLSDIYWAVSNTKNLRLIALLIDAETSAVINAATSPIKLCADASAIRSVGNDGQDVSVSVAGGSCAVTLTSAASTTAVISICTADGTVIAQHRTAIEGGISTRTFALPQHGLYLIHVNMSGHDVCKKILY